MDLHVTFAGQRRNDEGLLHHLPGPAWNPEEKKNIAEDGLNVQEDHIQDLYITNPEAYEDMLANRDLRIK